MSEFLISYMSALNDAAADSDASKAYDKAKQGSAGRAATALFNIICESIENESAVLETASDVIFSGSLGVATVATEAAIAAKVAASYPGSECEGSKALSKALRKLNTEATTRVRVVAIHCRSVAERNLDEAATLVASFKDGSASLVTAYKAIKKALQPSKEEKEETAKAEREEQDNALRQDAMQDAAQMFADVTLNNILNRVPDMTVAEYETLSPIVAALAVAFAERGKELADMVKPSKRAA